MNKKYSSVIGKTLLASLLIGYIAMPASAVKVVIEEDLVEGVIVTDQLVRVADNAIFLLDTSSSMNDKFRDTGETKLKLVEDAFKERNSFFPEIGHKFGIYTYTSWEEYYPVQTYDRDKVAAALDTVRKDGNGPTPLKKGLEELEGVIQGLTGRTAVFVFSDGEYTGGNPSKIARKLASNYDICFYVISTAKEGVETTLKEDVANLNACSRVIPLEYYLYRPEYQSGALFDVLVTEEIETTMETRISGLVVDDINFGFDKTELTDKDISELDELGEFMNEKPESYAIIAGYTDSTGEEDYNEGLSRRRTEIVASFMTENHNIGADRLVLQWYGSDNPMVSNDTGEGRAQNRRVEVAVGGL
jgi:OOP family OmpA-OmpF porin